jgi:hypothetical protein
MNPPSQDIKDYLAAQSSLGLTYATDLFVSEMPESPDLCVAVYDTGGFDPESDYSYERPTVQVKVRGDKGKYLIAHSLLQSIRDVLHATHGETINTGLYVGIWQMGDILFLGYDQNKRPELTANFRIHRTIA